MSLALWILAIVFSVFAMGYWRIRSINQSVANQQAVKRLTQPYRLQSTNRTNIGLVIAHPDDEAMFFTPTLKYLINQSIIPHVLCLTSGALGQSTRSSSRPSVRAKELIKSLRSLGIPQSNLTVIDDERLVDSLTVTWPMKPVQTIINQWLADCSIDRLITFDSRGGSGHPNHKSINQAVSMMLYQRSDLIAFELLTLPIAMKYLTTASWSLSIDHSSSTNRLDKRFVITSPDWSTAWRCMACHVSQFLWYRRLFVLFSGYTYANVWTQIK